MNQLADNLASPSVPPDRQSTLDAQVRARIEAELSHLRAEEEAVRSQIELALEKENLDRERALAADEDASASSTTLLGDLEEIKTKVDRFHSKRDLAEFPEVTIKSEAVASCYRRVSICH